MPKKAPPQKLAIGSSLGKTFSFIGHHKADLLRIAFVPMVFFLLGVMLQSMLHSPFGPDLTPTTFHLSKNTDLMGLKFYILAALLSGVAFFMLAIADFRYTLLGEHRAGDWFQIAWKKRHWRLLGYYVLYKLLLAAIFFLMVAGAVLVFSLSLDLPLEGLSTVPETLTLKIKTQSPTLILPFTYFLVGMFVLVYCMIRFMLFFPVVALDGQKPLRTSWHAMKRNMIRLFFLTGLIVVILALIYLCLNFLLFPIFIFVGFFSDVWTVHFVIPLLHTLFFAISLAIGTSFQSVLYNTLIRGTPKVHVLASKKGKKTS